MELKEELMNYKNITAKAIEVLNEEKYEEIEPLLNKREEIIEGLKSMNFKPEQFKDSCDEINLIQIENELNGLLKNKRDEVKFKLESTSKNRQANDSYNKIADSALIFSKKI